MVQTKSLLDRARDQENLYDWAGAADTYQEILESVSKEEPRMVGDLLERKAHALYKKALQAENLEEFRCSADTAEEAYEDSRTENQRVNETEGRARADRCDGMLSFLRFVRSVNADERRKHAAEAWKHARDALDAFDTFGNPTEFCKTFNDLFAGGILYSTLLPDHHSRKEVWMEVTSRGEKAVVFTRNLTDQDTIVRTLVFTSALLEKASFTGLYKEDADECHIRAVRLWGDAEKMSRDKTLAALPMAWIAGDAPIDPQRDSSNEIPAFRRALEIVRESRDRLAIGHALAGLSFYALWARNVPVDKEEIDALMTESLDCAIEARQEFLKIGFVAETGRRMWVMSPETSYYAHYAAEERDPKMKRELADSALKALPGFMTLARESGYCWVAAGADILAGWTFLELAKTETSQDRRLELLQKAEDHVNTGTKRFEELDSGNFLHLGIAHSSLADVRYELAEATTDCESRIEALRETMSLTRQSIEEHIKGMAMGHYTQDPSSNVNLGASRSRLGRLHRGLYELERHEDDLKCAVESYESSVESYLRAGQLSRAAENLWEAARVYDQLDNPARAAERFLSASKEFRACAKKVPRLKNLFVEQATYLEGWAEFERAKHHRTRQEYHQSRLHFEKAADIYNELDKWRFLALNSRAWAHIDNGEALSREDRRTEATGAFEEAAALFEESAVLLEEAGRSAENADEKRMISRLTKAAGPRRKYCLTRAMIEKARQMDVEGMSSSSSELYKIAADELDQLAIGASSVHDKTDIELRAILCRAWQKMNLAEAEVTSEPYADAALLFEKAKELSVNDKAKALALGHSRFCRALETGTKFADTREPALHVAAVKSLESASAYYVKAGADTCSEYARASKLLFDAYAYLAEASQEKEQKKAAKTYAKAEKILQACSTSYNKAGQPGKRDQVLKLLDRVKQDRELAVSLMEILEAPSGASSTVAFGAPSPTQEEAVGLDRFAHADVQATLIVQRRDLKVGEDMDVEIELVNAGRASAVLTKVENIIPSGFEVRSKPANYRIEDSYIMMKGKRLDPLKTEEIALVLKPTAHGIFQLRPRILYLDDEGQYKAQDVEGCEVTVKELGVTGWLKGPERRS